MISPPRLESFGALTNRQADDSDSIQRLARGVALSAAFASPLTGVRISGVNVVDYLLLGAVLLTLLATAVTGLRLPTYAWALIPPVVLLTISLTNSLFRGFPLSGDLEGRGWVMGEAVGAEYGGALPLVARMGLALTAVTIVVVGLTEVRSQRKRSFIERIIWAWAAGAVVSAAYGVTVHLSESERLLVGSVPFLTQHVSDRTAGLAHHPNALGQTVVFALPVLIYMVGAGRGAVKWLAIVSLPVSMYAIFLSGSRAALFWGPVLAVITFVYLSLSAKRILIWVIPLIVALVPLSIILLPGLLQSSRLYDGSAQVSNAVRIGSLEQGWRLFESDPLLGSGVGSWNAEMVPLIVLTSGGVVFFFVFYGCLAYPLVGLRRLAGDRFAAVLAISTLGVLGFGFLNNGFVERYLYWPLAALFALIVSSGSELARDAHTPHR